MIIHFMSITCTLILGILIGWQAKKCWQRKTIMGLVRVLTTASRDMHMVALAKVINFDDADADLCRNAGGVFAEAAHVLEWKVK